MKIKSIVTRGTFLGALLAGASLPLQAQDHKALHQKAIVVDTHNDVLIAVMDGLDIAEDLRGKTHSDLARFKEGGVDVQIFSVWSDETYGKGKGFAYANRQIDSLYAIAARNPDKLRIVTSPEELMQAVKQQKLAAMIGVEGGHMIEDKLGYLDSLYSRGTRYLTLTWNNSTSWASSAADETGGTVPNAQKGLNDFGRQVVRRMNELGMMVDLSHVGEQTFWDVMETTTKPVIVSHSSAYAIRPHARNLKDEQIRAIAKNGGVIQLNFFSGFLDSKFDKRQKQFLAKHQAELDSLKKLGWSTSRRNEWLKEKYPAEANAVRPPLSLLLDHLDHIVKLVGVDYVGFGSDFDGISSAPQQLDGVEDFPVLTRELLVRGYSAQDIEKILGGNFLRVFQENAVPKS
ncbi:membrane dipeptidase [Pontibacter ummariensis]|uniref:Membrane dipeptidase n=1 Tax=Pontibacter ummariensis TaxID=1610492 RepID=A0A239LAW3_9BACT|nr:dipeptidase [Pontibacter ummariensis]PRY03997.1 membrane dipeptidase [Pontibacter ummariensis]SNT26694.1 membrane dipeptidase [Pontibacter ummariensis]